MRVIILPSIFPDLAYAFNEGRRSNANNIMRRTIVTRIVTLIGQVSLPFFLNIEGPIELQMSLLVVVHKFRNGFVVPSSKHA